MQAAVLGHRTQAFFQPTNDSISKFPEDSAPEDSSTQAQRFCLWHMPMDACDAPKALVVFVPPFAEEMNKSRRMAALQCQALVQAGCAVLQLDLLGCGDSGGNFADATWDAWVADVVRACSLAQQRFARDWSTAPRPPLWLWGVRAGCLLATAAAAHLARLEVPVNFLFWQPSASGKPVLQQFLRLKVAASLGQGDAKGVAEQLRQEIANGRAVNIAGYELSAALATGLEAARLSPPARGTRVLWLEVSARPEAALLPVSQTAVQQWRDAGHQVSDAVVLGPSFWSTVEIEDAPALLQASTQMLLQASTP